ncbi:MAG: histidine phosphatase family protein [Campylobacterota bacterium]|nr:histidine phosphatase family protein [Campylobacterota bacterium]
MKKLYIIRHAKSSWKDSSLDDFDRPLNKRGKLNAPFMGTILKDKNVVPDIIISSPALRAKSTAKIIAKKVKYLKDIVYKKAIYEESTVKLHAMLRKIDNDNDIAFLIGHNPELNILAGHYAHFNENIVTCGVVEIEFACNRWSEICAKNAKLISFDYPKKHKEML